MQEAYVRGVSAWNFDVAALKQAASHEGATDLATVPEGKLHKLHSDSYELEFFRLLLFLIQICVLQSWNPTQSVPDQAQLCRSIYKTWLCGRHSSTRSDANSRFNLGHEGLNLATKFYWMLALASL